MSTRRIGSVVLLLAAVAFSQTAEDASSCGGTTYDMNVCLSKIYQKADAELNMTYSAALKELGQNYSGPKHVENLRAAEKTWIAYRDAECNAQYDLFEGGSGGPNEYLGCLIDMTKRRTAELKRVYLSH